MKKIIDMNKLTTALVAGEASYSDGRHDFNYELLTKVLSDIGITIDSNMIWDESQRRNRIRSERHFRRHFGTTKQYQFDVLSDSEVHLNAVFALHEERIMPSHLYEVSMDWDYETEPRIYRYRCYGRTKAAEALRYLRKVHPDGKFTITITTLPR